MPITMSTRAKKKYVYARSQRTRLFAVQKEKRRRMTKKEKSKWKERGKQDGTKKWKNMAQQPASQQLENTADAAIQPTSGAATILGSE